MSEESDLLELRLTVADPHLGENDVQAILDAAVAAAVSGASAVERASAKIAGLTATGDTRVLLHVVLMADGAVSARKHFLDAHLTPELARRAIVVASATQQNTSGDNV